MEIAIEEARQTRLTEYYWLCSFQVTILSITASDGLHNSRRPKHGRYFLIL